MSEVERWLEAESAGAPEPLRERVTAYLKAGPASGSLPERLARCARTALEGVLTRPGTRSVALDLLAADALVTLALKAQAGRDPDALERFAGELLGD